MKSETIFYLKRSSLTNSSKRANSEPPEGPISIRGRVASWLEVKRKNGEALISRMFLPGEILSCQENGVFCRYWKRRGIESSRRGTGSPLGIKWFGSKECANRTETLDQIIKKP